MLSVARPGSKGSLSSLSSKLGANLAVVQTRQDFTKSIANTLSTGADNLVNADLNEQATTLLALQTSQSLAQSALSLVQPGEPGRAPPAPVTIGISRRRERRGLGSAVFR